MDHCALSFQRPEPLVCQGVGRVRLDAREGDRRLLGELVFQAPVELHHVEVEAKCRCWPGREGAVYAVTVRNRSSLPLDWASVSTAGAAPGAPVRVDGLLQPEADLGLGVELPGLDAGAEAVVTWQGPLPPPGREAPPVTVSYRCRFAGEELEGEVSL